MFGRSVVLRGGRRLLNWSPTVVALVLLSRAIVYASAPSTTDLVRRLEGKFGGPEFIEVVVVASVAALCLGAVMVWAASFGVRERWELSEHRSVARPRIRLRALLGRAVVLTLVSWLMFGVVESVEHARAGLGWHGLECLIGPMHRNALPVVAALAVIVSALISCARLVLAWMRRTVATFGRAATRFTPGFSALAWAPDVRIASDPVFGIGAPRGPPVIAV